jgi:ankyrin repeat protein
MSEPELPPLYYASVANDLAEVERLLKAGAEVNDGESIYHAAERNHRAVIDLLIQYGCDISGRHAVYGNTPLFFLCGFGNDDNGQAAWHHGAAYLLDRGADPNMPSGERHDTPLHQLATAPGAIATLKLLLDRGAKPACGNAQGITPYQVAVRSNNTAAVDLLAERGGAVPLTGEDEFVVALRRGDEQRARELLIEDPAVERVLAGEIGFAGTLLHWAAWTGNIPAVRALIALGADVNRRDREFGSSPLGWAAHGSTNCRAADDDYCAVVNLLRDAGARRDASINRFNEPPEDMATPQVALLLAQ